MAVQVIAFPVAARQNTNDDSTAYGKWFLVPFWPETLNLRGLIERVAFDQSVYSRDIVEGVIQKLTTVMVELLKSGQPVKWDGLGTFTPNINSKGVNSTSKVSVLSRICVRSRCSVSSSPPRRLTPPQVARLTTPTAASSSLSIM